MKYRTGNVAHGIDERSKVRIEVHELELSTALAASSAFRVLPTDSIDPLEHLVQLTLGQPRNLPPPVEPFNFAPHISLSLFSAMAPFRVTKPRHTARKAPTQIPATDEDSASQQSSQSSEGDDKAVKMAEKMRRDVRDTISVQFPQPGSTQDADLPPGQGTPTESPRQYHQVVRGKDAENRR